MSTLSPEQLASRDRKNAELDRLMKKMNAEQAKNSPDSPPKIMRAKDHPHMKQKWFISTGNPALDRALGGGWRRGVAHEIYGREGSGKSLSHGSKILTPTGWVNIENISAGDKIFAYNGKITHVTGVFPQGVLPVFKVTFCDGATVRASADHLWTVYPHSRNIPRGQRLYEVKPEVVTTERLKESLESCAPDERSPYRLPVIGRIDFENTIDLPLDPYVMGCLIGDGSLVTNVRFTNIDPEIIEYIGGHLPTTDKITLNKNGGKEYRITGKTRGTNTCLQIIRMLGLYGHHAWDKFVPDCYMLGSYSQRLSVLQGLMDTDGSITKSNGCEYCTTSPVLAKQVVELARSLGGTAKASQYFPESSRTYWRVRITLPTNPFKLGRKAERYISPEERYTLRKLKSVETDGESECTCISIADGSALFITDDYIVTHNTVVAMMAIAEFIREGRIACYIGTESPEFPIDQARAAGLTDDEIDQILFVPAFGAAENLFNVVQDYIYDPVKSTPRYLIDCMVIDSIAGLIPNAVVKSVEANGFEGNTIGRLASLTSKLYPFLMSTIPRHGVLISVNQLRVKISTSGPSPEDSAGGNAVRYYNKTRTCLKVDTEGMKKLTHKNELTKLDEREGNAIRFQVVKNNAGGRPGATGKYRYFFDKGLDMITPIVDEALDAGIIAKPSSVSYVIPMPDGTSTKVSGRDKMTQFVEDNPEVFSALKNLVEASRTTPGVVAALGEAEPDITDILAEPVPEDIALPTEEELVEEEMPEDNEEEEEVEFTE